MTARDDAVQAIAPFSEKGFYLSEFRGRTLAISVASSELRERAALREVLADLAANEASEAKLLVAKETRSKRRAAARRVTKHDSDDAAELNGELAAADMEG